MTISEQIQQDLEKTVLELKKLQVVKVELNSD